ncbi:hypothetical protein [Hymenobacter elongatus]|uniref:Outer membrane protein beta-barrel domain-containing protein n=1 Tax=Hymenobacter elongatus TaxID=877208 RepID=A0A4Z0PGY3_9BACT|nr:hypothetical protein [Hymenobacter elongatus]TGE14404.1 hypothetical protein E5J99_16275 [Hymenobacter elongatus]
MKRILLVLALGSTGLWLAPAAQAQTDTTRTTVKPQLNTAPPGSAVPRPAQPSSRPAVPVPAPPPVDQPLPQPQPGSNSPSGLELPAGTSSAEQPKPVYKLFLYGNVGLGYSSYNGIGQFSASIGPSIGYRVTEKFAIGPGVSYSYNNYSFQGAGNLKLNSVGLKVFAQYIVYQQFFAHAEYEATRSESFDLVPVSATQAAIVPVTRNYRTPLAGIGYRTPIGDRFAADIVVLYNFNDGYTADGSPLSPYGQPVIRFNFLYNLKWKL